MDKRPDNKNKINLTNRGKAVVALGLVALGVGTAEASHNPTEMTANPVSWIEAPLADGIGAVAGGADVPSQEELSSMPAKKVTVQPYEGANSVIETVDPGVTSTDPALTDALQDNIEAQHPGPLYPNEQVKVPIVPTNE